MKRTKLMIATALAALVFQGSTSLFAVSNPLFGRTASPYAFTVKQTEPQEGVKKAFRLTFPSGVGELQESYGANMPEMSALRRIARDNKEDLLYLISYASLEGSPSTNIRLSDRRAAAVKAFLVQEGFPEGNIIIRNAGEDWEGLTGYVSSHSFEGQADAAAILGIKSLNNDQKKSALKALSGGKVWQYLVENAMSDLRVVELAVVDQDSPLPVIAYQAAPVPCEPCEPCPPLRTL